jgi:hypothetical protein
MSILPIPPERRIGLGLASDWSLKLELELGLIFFCVREF